PTGAECRKEWDPRHTRPTATRSSVPRNLTTHEDRTYNVAVLRSGQSELRFVQPRFQRTLPNQLFRCTTDGAFYGNLAGSMEFLPNLSRSVESICNKSTICNCSTKPISYETWASKLFSANSPIAPERLLETFPSLRSIRCKNR